jgi:hypothetical protein
MAAGAQRSRKDTFVVALGYSAHQGSQSEGVLADAEVEGDTT